MTREAGAIKVDGVFTDARTGAIIRGSSMATLVLTSLLVVLLSESFRDGVFSIRTSVLTPAAPAACSSSSYHLATALS
jgi:hypothetical protein